MILQKMSERAQFDEIGELFVLKLDIPKTLPSKNLML